MLCISQLVELNNYIEEVESLGYTVYGISPSDPMSHSAVMDGEGLDFDLLTDVDVQFGSQLGFIDFDDEVIYRGYTAVNPETNQMVTEIDYLVGENALDVLKVLEDL
ncbi:peroxiredoxin family protein [Bacillus shivajii]|uniref:redoxin domain-containing protein n=1 Tax=Bacillus shivajii TaxID=1983719 RepID=UPI001CF9C381|nr:redoxin domain-containing protein [Bacillus shivajii]UCZ52455.1 peroxiredoxin family protein [Bacillus shivajii]